MLKIFSGQVKNSVLFHCRRQFKSNSRINMKQLIEFILFVFVSSFIINGFYEVTRRGKIFGFWQHYWEQYTQLNDTDEPKYKFPKWLRYPVSECVMCMASIYGTIIFLIAIFIFKNQELRYGYSSIELFFILAAYLLCLTCANYVVHQKLK